MKKTKPGVDYSPSTGEDYCGICEHFVKMDRSSGTCDLVAGSISPHYWCRLFKRRERK
jgi:hypothetical protein